jgi:hypothetical protein
MHSHNIQQSVGTERFCFSKGNVKKKLIAERKKEKCCCIHTASEG